MSRLRNFLNELKSDYLYGLTVFDIDETIARTFAKIKVIDKNTGQVVRELDNQQFNADVLGPEEEYDFSQFRSGKLFLETSIPIEKTVKRIKRMIKMLKKNERKSRIIFLTARSSFPDKKNFLQWFKNQGIDVSNKDILYIERSGDLSSKLRSQGAPLPIEEVKKKIIVKYLKNGIYRRVRLVDDYTKNLDGFLTLADDMPQDIIEKVRKNANIPEGSDEAVMELYALHIDSRGNLTLYNKREIR